jgi:hypothetical protein
MVIVEAVEPQRPAPGRDGRGRTGWDTS